MQYEYTRGLILLYYILVTHMKRVHPELETHNDLNLIQPQPANDDQATNTISEGTTQPQQVQ